MTKSKKLISLILSILMVLSCFSGMGLTAFAAPTCPNPGCGSTNVEPFLDTWECQDCGYIFESSSGDDEDNITFTKVTDESQIAVDNIGTCAAEDAKAWALANWDDLDDSLEDSFFAEIAFYSNTGELNFVQMYSGLREEDLSTYFDVLVDTASISNLQEWFAEGHSVFICTPAASAEDGPLVGTVIKIGDTLTLDGDYIEVMPGVIDQATDSFKLERMEYDNYFNGWGAVFESSAFLIAGDETPEPDGFYVSGGNGTQSHPYTIALHYASAAPVTEWHIGDPINLGGKYYINDDQGAPSSYGFDRDVIVSEPVYETMYNQWIFENVIASNASEAYALYISLPTGKTASDVPTGFKVKSGDGTEASPYEFELVYAAAATAYADYVNTTTVIKFDDKDWYLIEDNSTSATEGTVTLLSKECVGASIFGGSSTYSGSTVEGVVNNYYTNSISTDAKAAVDGNGMFLLTTDQANAIKTANVDVLKCSKATGAESILWWLGSPCDPYNAACVYGDDRGIRDSGEYVERTLGVRPALKLDLSKVEFDSETKTFALPQPLVEYSLWVGGVKVTNKNASNIDGNNKASYDAETNTLTLNGYTNSGTARADINSGVNNAAIYYNDNMSSPNPLTIQLAEGTTNSLTMTGDRVYGIYVFGSALTITGNGTLNVQSEEMAINDAWGVAITDGTVNAASSAYYGIGRVTIGADISSVTITGELGAIYGGSNEDQELINAVAGTGWTDVAGTTGQAAIATSTTGQNVSSYKKVQFPAAPHTHDEITFEPWTSTNSLPAEEGSYYLTADVALEDTWYVPYGTINLCLDGHTITCAENREILLMNVSSGTIFNLYDKEDNSGTITGGYSSSGGVQVYYEGIFNMYGGTITGNTSTDHGGGVRAFANSTFNMYGGSIENNKTQNQGGFGGGVHIESGTTFNMYGGTIKDNTASSAGGVFVGTDCTFNLCGGSITGNATTGGEGGAVLFTDDGSATFKLSGDVTVSGNVTKIDIDEINVHETYPSNMVIPDSVTIEVVDALTGEGKIYVQIGTTRVFTNSTGSVKAKDYINKFVSDSETYRIRTEGDELKIEAPYLRVGGTFVYDDNAADVFKDGKVKFTPANDTTTSATLTLNGYQYDGTADDDSEGIIYLDSAQLRIVLQGENIVKATNPGIMINRGADTIISSENGGSLEVVSKQGDAIYSNGSLAVDSGTITATGNNRGIAANGVYFNGGRIVATGTGTNGYGIYCDSLPWLPSTEIYINSGVTSLVASGTAGATFGNVMNLLEGQGWSDVIGITDQTAIAVPAEARSLGYKKVAFISHTHNFTYSVNGATITATCTADDCTLTDNKVTLTIVAPTLTTYGQTGEGISEKATLDGLDAFNAATGLNVNADSIVYWNAKIQEGVYKTNGDEPLTAAPTNAGSYLAKITVNNCIASIGYTIAKADPTFTTTVTITPDDYKSGDAITKDGVTVASHIYTNPNGMTLMNGGTITSSVGNITNIEVTAQNSPFGDGWSNGTWTGDSSSVSFSNYVYYFTQIVCTIESNASPEDLTATYGDTLADVELPDGWSWADDTQSVGNVGTNTFKATFTPEDTDNYNVLENLDVTVTVGKASINPTVTLEGWAYGDTPNTPVVTGNPGNGEVTFTYAVKGSDDFSETVPTAVNDYTVKATIAETDNYNGKTVTADFAISKAAPAVTAPEANELIYNGKEQTLTTEAATEDGKIAYALGADATTAPEEGWSKDVPSAKAAGKYFVWYRVFGDGDHSDLEPVCIEASIAAAKVTITAENKSSKREAALAKLTCTLEGEIFEGDDLGILVTTNAKAAVAGKYAIKVSYTENANYDVTVVNGTYTVIDRITTNEKTAGKNKINSAVKATVNKDGSVTAKWGAVANAQRFEIYANYCGEKNEFKKIKTVDGNVTSFKITKLGGKKLDQKKSVKIYIIAYRKVNGKYEKITQSVQLHVVGKKNTKYSNAKSIKVNKDEFTLSVKKSATIKPTLVLENSRRKAVEHLAKFRYQSTNTAVATVDKNGKIKAVGKGTCTIYIFANNGKLKSVKVTVK